MSKKKYVNFEKYFEKCYRNSLALFRKISKIIAENFVNYIRNFRKSFPKNSEDFEKYFEHFREVFREIFSKKISNNILETFENCFEISWKSLRKFPEILQKVSRNTAEILEKSFKNFESYCGEFAELFHKIILKIISAMFENHFKKFRNIWNIFEKYFGKY